jgi:outer membrane protein assembly factor BamB
MIWNYTADDSIGAFSVSVGILSFGCSNGYVYALNISNGHKLWTFGTNATPYYTKWGDSVGNAFPTPIAVGAVVYVSSANGYVYALNAASGAILWSYSVGSPLWSGFSVANGNVFLDSVFGMFAL